MNWTVIDLKVYYSVRKQNDQTLKLLADVKNELSRLSVEEVPFERRDQADAFVVLGGDGSIVRAAKDASAFHLPVLGINSGRVGFLAGLEPDELPLLSRLVSGEYTVEKRMMLSVTYESDHKPVTGYALNEVSITRDGMARLLDFSVSLEGRKDVLRYRADGLLFATPTGSTAYSLSAGGPVVDPEINGIVVTPLCPFSLMSRSLVFSAEHTLQAQAENNTFGAVSLCIDGRDPADITGQTVTISRADDRVVRLIRIKQEPFFNAYKNKIIDRSI